MLRGRLPACPLTLGEGRLPTCPTRLERDLGTQLNGASAASTVDAGSRSECARDVSVVAVVCCGVRVRELRRVGHVEALEPELHFEAFVQLDGARERGVQREEIRPAENIASAVPLNANVLHEAALGKPRVTDVDALKYVHEIDLVRG